MPPALGCATPEVDTNDAYISTEVLFTQKVYNVPPKQLSIGKVQSVLKLYSQMFCNVVGSVLIGEQNIHRDRMYGSEFILTHIH